MSHMPANALVWCEIPTTDMAAAMRFYSAVFDYDLKLDESGPNPMAMLPYEGDGIAGHIYPGTPAGDGTGPTIHLIVPDNLEATVERCKEAGGQVLSPAIDIPPGRFAYALDLDGNSISFFEPKA